MRWAAGPYLLERRQRLPRPLGEVFPFFAEPRNLGEITPGWLGFRLLDEAPGAMARGLRLHYRIRPLGLPQGWTSEITAWQPPHRFVDEQVRGPYRRWHHEHLFRPVEDGTEVVDRVTYALPLGPLGRVAHGALVRRQLEAIFDYRRRRVAELLG